MGTPLFDSIDTLPISGKVMETANINSDNGEEENLIDVAIPPATNLNDLGKIPKPPIWGLPKLLQDMITQGSEVYGTPIDFFLIYILAAIGAALRKSAKLISKHVNYPQLWFMVVAPSGIGKSEPLRMAFAPLYKRDQKLFDDYQQSLKQWKVDCLEAKKHSNPEPPCPICQQILTTDITPEALLYIIYKNNSICISRDEIAGLFNDIGRYSKSGEIEHYLSTFNNGQIRIDRKGDNPLLIPEPFLSIVGTVQPCVLEGILHNKELVGNGMLARFLFAYPDNQKKAKYRNEIMSPELLEQYDQYLNILCDYNEVVTQFSDEAMELFVTFSDELTDRSNEIEDEHIKSMLSKMDIQVSRLALIVYCSKLIAKETSEEKISAEIMKYCIELCRYFISTAEKAYQLSDTSKANHFFKNLTNKELMKLFNERYPIKNINKFADSIGKTRQNISKMLN